MPVAIACRCGQRFLAQDHLFGQQVACPACGGPLLIPLPAPEPLPLAPLPLAPVPVAPAPFSTLPPARPAAGSSSQWLWLVGIGGVGLLLLLVMVTIIALGSGGGAGQAANKASSKPTSSSPPPVIAPPRRTSPFSSTSSSPPPAPKSTPAKSSDNATGDSDASGFGQPSGAKARPLEHSITSLPGALTTWHDRPSRSLTGILNPTSDEHPIAHLSWMTGLLPYLGHQREYDRLKLDQPLTDEANLEVAEVVIPEFQNPRDDRKKWDGYPFDGLALTHFVGISGVEDARNVCAAKLPRSDPRAGIFGYDAIALPDEITDGTSHTIMIAGSGRLANPWMMGGGATIRGAREPLFDKVSGLGTKGLSSGTVVLMADGSVRQIPTSIDPAVFKAMCTIHGAESVDLERSGSTFHLENLK
jgi:hypothetical protein